MNEWKQRSGRERKKEGKNPNRSKGVRTRRERKKRRMSTIRGVKEKVHEGSYLHDRGWSLLLIFFLPGILVFLEKRKRVRESYERRSPKGSKEEKKEDEKDRERKDLQFGEI